MYIKIIFALLIYTLHICDFFFPEIKCGKLSDVHQGSVALDCATFGCEAKYRCSDGFVLRYGDSIRTCLEQGWSGAQPCCISGKLKSSIS